MGLSVAFCSYLHGIDAMQSCVTVALFFSCLAHGGVVVEKIGHLAFIGAATAF